jgi:hypothetical protein
MAKITRVWVAAAAVNGDGLTALCLRLGTATVTGTSLEHGFPMLGAVGAPGQGRTSRPRRTFSPGAIASGRLTISV